MGVSYTPNEMKGLPRYDLKTIAILCIISLRVMSFNSVEAQTTAKELLELKERELNIFVDAVERNSADCDVMKGCSSDKCSRLACYQYGTPGDANYECLEVANNTLKCDTPSCMKRNFDFSRSVIRLVDPVERRTARTICTHRSLDSHFRNSTMVDPNHFFRVYFGAVDGTWRLYPGADEVCDYSVDNRIRPWYREAIDIPKVVTVLIDSGIFMRGIITASTQETYMSKGITAALQLLKTLRENVDYVTFLCFDGDGPIKQLNDWTMLYTKDVYDSLEESLTRVVANASKTNPTPEQTNFFLKYTMNQLAYSKPEDYLKVVVAFIGGQQYKNNSDLNITQFPNVNLFIYSFRAEQEYYCDPALRASLEGIPNERLNNPLYALHSYYSFLGKLHRSFMKNATNFGIQYEDYSGIDEHTLTLSKAAFGPNGELLGVVGLDFFERKVNDSYSSFKWDSVVEEAGKHDSGRTFNTSTDLSTNVCFSQTDPCPGLDSANVQGFLCSTKSDDPKIGCCGTCRPSRKHKLKLWEIALIVVAGVLCCLGVCGVIYYRKRTRPNSPPKVTEFPGGRHETPLSSGNQSSPG